MKTSRKLQYFAHPYLPPYIAERVDFTQVCSVEYKLIHRILRRFFPYFSSTVVCFLGEGRNDRRLRSTGYELHQS